MVPVQPPPGRVSLEQPVKPGLLPVPRSARRGLLRVLTYLPQLGWRNAT